MEKLVVAIAVGICMGGFSALSALSANAEEPGAPDASPSVEEPEIFENAGVALIHLVGEFEGSERYMGEPAGMEQLRRSRRVVDTAARSSLEARFAEFVPRLRLAQIVLTMLEGDTILAAVEFQEFSLGYKDDGSCVSGFTSAAIMFVQAELAYRTNEAEGFTSHAKAAEFAFQLKNRGEYCTREAHKLSAAYFILLAEEYARDEKDDQAIETFMKAIVAASTEVDPSIEERVLRFVAVSIEGGYPDLGVELRARADAIGAYKNRSEQWIIDPDTVIFGIDFDWPVNEDPSIVVVYLIHGLTDRYRTFSRQR